MPKLYCNVGDHEVKVSSQRHRGERFCPEHPDCELRQLPKKKGTRASIKNTAAYGRANQAFNAVVCSERCYFGDLTEEGDPRRPGHTCRYPLDGHHLVSKDWILQHFADLPLRDLLAILFDPRIGAPLCRVAHDQVEYSSAPDTCIYFDELRIECIEFCEWVDEKYGDVPTAAGGKRPSMLERLKLESPAREVVS